MYIATVSNADQKVNDKKRVPKKVMSATMSAEQTFVSRIIGMRLQGIFFWTVEKFN